MRAPFQVLVIPFRAIGGRVEFALFRRSEERYWQFIAGGGEGSETPAQAAIRETVEEAGLTGAMIPLESRAQVPRSSFVARDHWDRSLSTIPEHCFALDVGGDRITLSPEHSEFRWVSHDEGCKLLHWDSNRTALRELSRKLRR